MNLCRCGHYFNAHTEFGYTGRKNGPITYRACKLCDCWRPIKSKAEGE